MSKQASEQSLQRRRIVVVVIGGQARDVVRKWRELGEGDSKPQALKEDEAMSANRPAGRGPCIVCGRGVVGDHRECMDAYSLDYDPASQRDAIAWLDKRRAAIRESMSKVTKR